MNQSTDGLVVACVHETWVKTEVGRVGILEQAVVVYRRDLFLKHRLFSHHWSILLIPLPLFPERSWNVVSNVRSWHGNAGKPSTKPGQRCRELAAACTVPTTAERCHRAAARQAQSELHLAPLWILVIWGCACRKFCVSYARCDSVLINILWWQGLSSGQQFNSKSCHHSMPIACPG
jgi:hypothetical protein